MKLDLAAQFVSVSDLYSREPDQLLCRAHLGYENIYMVIFPLLLILEEKFSVKDKIQPLSLEFAVLAFASHKKIMCSIDLSFFSCCPQRHLLI